MMTTTVERSDMLVVDEANVVAGGGIAGYNSGKKNKMNPHNNDTLELSEVLFPEVEDRLSYIEEFYDLITETGDWKVELLPRLNIVFNKHNVHGEVSILDSVWPLLEFHFGSSDKNYTSLIKQVKAAIEDLLDTKQSHVNLAWVSRIGGANYTLLINAISINRAEVSPKELLAKLTGLVEAVTEIITKHVEDTP